MIPCFDFDGTLMRLKVDWSTLKYVAANRVKSSGGFSERYFSENVQYLLDRNEYIEVAEKFEMPTGKPVISHVNKKLIKILGSNKRSLVFSNNLTKTIIRSFEIQGLAIGPDKIYGVDRLKFLKPQLGIVPQILAQHHINPSEVVYYGDRDSDETFSLQCGFKFQRINGDEQ